MIKVVLERTIRGKHVKEAVLLMRQMRVLAMQQSGYISGETLHAVDDPNHYLVIRAWESLEHWQDWFKNSQRQKIQQEVDKLLGTPTIIRAFTY